MNLEMTRLLEVAVGGALGSLARYALSGLVHRLTSTSVTLATFPLGTFVVNVVGCLIFGIVVALAEERFAIGSSGRTLLLIGLLGGFTTFSTFTFETFELMREAQFLWALLNAAGQLIGGLVAIWAGYSLIRSL